MINAPGEGWTPAHIDIATTNGNATFQGWHKGSFGIIELSVELKLTGWEHVASLTHLGTGWRIAAFSNAGDAAIAGDLAEQCADWSTLRDPSSASSPAWKEAKDRMVALWKDAGLHPYFAADTVKPTGDEIPKQSEAGHESRL